MPIVLTIDIGAKGQKPWGFLEKVCLCPKSRFFKTLPFNFSV